jgi:small subunit ribosomal protein S6
MKYELFYLVGASKEADLAQIRKDVNSIITGNGGEFSEKETLEKRKMAYKMKHETHGIYIAQRFELPEPEKMKDINSKLNLHTGVLRFVLSRADELPELRSKEERMNESVRKETPRVETPAEETKKTAPEETKPEPEKDKKTQEDIDKKLEEILNI